MPGPTNPLGRIKFDMRNDLAIYLHDTPDKRSFAGDERAYSSGCIRLEQPLALAGYLLRNRKDWPKDRIHWFSKLTAGAVPSSS